MVWSPSTSSSFCRSDHLSSQTPAEAENTFYQDNRYLRVPMANALPSRLCDFPGPTSQRTRPVEVKKGHPCALRFCVFSAASGSPSRCAPGPSHPAVGSRPATAPGQLVHCEFKLVGKNPVLVVDVISDVCEKEVGLMTATRKSVLVIAAPWSQVRICC